MAEYTDQDFKDLSYRVAAIEVSIEAIGDEISNLVAAIKLSHLKQEQRIAVDPMTLFATAFAGYMLSKRKHADAELDKIEEKARLTTEIMLKGDVEQSKAAVAAIEAIFGLARNYTHSMW